MNRNYRDSNGPDRPGFVSKSLDILEGEPTQELSVEEGYLSVPQARRKEVSTCVKYIVKLCCIWWCFAFFMLLFFQKKTKVSSSTVMHCHGNSSRSKNKLSRRADNKTIILDIAANIFVFAVLLGFI